MQYVPVVDSNQQPLMPTTPNRAASWIKSGKATPFWKKGIFCVRLNQEPSSRVLQDIVVGVDPGSKEEGFSVKSKAHTYFDVQAKAIDWVKKAVETRRTLRRNRRHRKTPCRKNRENRKRGSLPPSTKARWGWKLRIVNWLCKIFPISSFCVEDIKARAKKFQKRWNSSFSPLEVGKNWFYDSLPEDVYLLEGHQTAKRRENRGLKKLKNKLSTSFYSHCVDAWVLAQALVGGKRKPENTQVLRLVPLRFHRRQLHVQNFQKEGVRKEYGGTRGLGFKRGSLVKHLKFGLTYVGGSSKERVSLHSLETGERLTQNAKPQDIKFLTYCSWRFNS